VTAAHICAVTLLAFGVGFLILAAIALIRLPGPYSRLHALSVASSVGFPLVCLAVVVQTGLGRAAVKVLFLGALSAIAGPITSMAVGRAELEAREGEPKGSAA
jgi:multicomponent Na+:H+ antiporter subunit G